MACPTLPTFTDPNSRKEFLLHHSRRRTVRSSRLLTELSLTKSSPHPFFLRTGGDVYRKTDLYSLTDSESLALYAAMIRLISSYPRLDRGRQSLVTELGMLVTYHLYPQHDEYSEENDADDLEYALDMIRGWWEDWRFGEEWIRDALVAMVQTGNIEHLPWASSPAPIVTNIALSFQTISVE
ncbi:hypothetical protein C8R45DRAFT_599553 [Mycena sanguinolenta]|nr:hypothetical protein C8R45DRAFT_599553 [Mycena sanguinolenta]